MDVPHPDEKSIITYVSSLYDAIPRFTEAQASVKANVSISLIILKLRYNNPVPDLGSQHIVQLICRRTKSNQTN